MSTCLLLLACGPQSPGSEFDGPLEPEEVGQPGAQTPAPVQPTTQGRSWYVSLKGADTAKGTSTAPVKTIGRAVALAAPGDVILIQPGVYEESLTLDARGATAAAITLRGEGDTRPTLIPGTQKQGSVIRVRGRWNLENLNIDVKNAAKFAVSFESTAHFSTLVHCELQDGTAGSGVVVEGARSVTLRDNHIHHFNRPDDDAHGVTVVGPAQDTVIQGNDIHHNSGDSVQCQAGSAPAVGLRIENNSLHDEGENGVDIKTCQDVTIRNNAFRGFPNRAVRPMGSSAGEAVVIHLSARDVRVLDNRIERAGRGISILGDGADPENIRLERNQIWDIRNTPASNGQGIRIESARNVAVLDNVVEDTASYGLMLAADGRTVTGLEVRNNIVKKGVGGALLVRLGRDAHRPGLRMTNNRYSTGGILKADGVSDRLTGQNASYREDFSGEQLTLASSAKLESWQWVLGVDGGSLLLE